MQRKPNGAPRLVASLNSEQRAGAQPHMGTPGSKVNTQISSSGNGGGVALLG